MDMTSVINAFATVNENNEVTTFDFASFDKLVSELVTKRAEIRKENKAQIKQAAEADKDALAVVGKKYYELLDEGAEFQYKTADGTVVTGNKIVTKSGSNASAAIEVTSGIDFKTDNHKRYPKFYQVIVPEDFSVEE